MKRLLIVFVFFLTPFLLFPQSKEVKPKVTFIELGSVNCIPCKQMQPVMKSIEEKYGG
jgi:thiol-disulfide isomerase/thioredoxin